MREITAVCVSARTPKGCRLLATESDDDGGAALMLPQTCGPPLTSEVPPFPREI